MILNFKTPEALLLGTIMSSVAFGAGHAFSRNEKEIRFTDAKISGGKSTAITLSGTTITYGIPKNLIESIDLSPKSNGARRGLLIALLPGVDGRDEHNNDKFRTASDVIVIAFDSTGDGNVSVEDRQNSVLSSWRNIPKIDLGTRYGLLAQRQVPPQKGNWRWHEIYSLKDNSTLSLSIVCDGDGLYPTPGCSMIFLIEGALIKATFRKMHLENWRGIHSNLIAKFSEWRY